MSLLPIFLCSRRYLCLSRGVSHWLWGKIVQYRLDQAIRESENHRVRKQANRLLPSGGRRIDFYRNPEQWGGTDLLISIDRDLVDELLDEYDLPEYTQFGSNSMVKLCECLFDAIGSPLPLAKEGWSIWQQMTATLPQLALRSRGWKVLEAEARADYIPRDTDDPDTVSDTESLPAEEDFPDDDPSFESEQDN